MERAAENNHVLLACGNACQFDCAFYGLRAGIAEEESINLRRHNSAQFFDQPQHRLMNHNICLRVEKEAGLLANRFDDLRMAVSCICHTNAAGEVKQFFAIHGVDI
jgi:hypothetical protein